MSALNHGADTGACNCGNPGCFGDDDGCRAKMNAPIKAGLTDSTTTPPTQPALRAATMSLFPTMGSLQQVIDLANSQLPIQTPNAILSLLMIYHNTLLQVMERETNFVTKKEF